MKVDTRDSRTQLKFEPKHINITWDWETSLPNDKHHVIRQRIKALTSPIHVRGSLEDILM